MAASVADATDVAAETPAANAPRSVSSRPASPGSAVSADVYASPRSLVAAQDDRAFIAHLAFLFLSHDRADRAAALFALLAHDAAADDPIRGALALAQLRAGKPKAASGTLSAMPVRVQVRAPYQLLRAQILAALGRHDEAGHAMQAFAAARITDLSSIPGTTRPTLPKPDA
jgi:thioredoxin-like negative regulator of GroEL